jgi:hypothetical protein
MVNIMRAVSAILLGLIILVSTCASQMATQGEARIPLKNDTYILPSEILSFRNDIISEYNKNFERYPPQNKLLFSNFILTRSFNSTILVSYYGTIGFSFDESNISNVHVMYANKDQEFIFGGVGFSNKPSFINILFYNDSFNDRNIRYGYVTNVYSLTPYFSRKLAHDYYLLDFALYIQENASLNKIGDLKRLELNKALQKLMNAYQSGDEFQKAKTTVDYYQLAVYDLGYSEESSKKIWKNR